MLDEGVRSGVQAVYSKSADQMLAMLYNYMYALGMQEINVSEFRRKCLTLVDDLPPEGILITKRGHPVAKLTPLPKSCADLIGSVPGLVLDPKDDLFSTRITWDAES